MPVSDDDWRLRAQDRYLTGAVLHLATYRTHSDSWDHEHCEFCLAKFTEQVQADSLQSGYTTDDDRHWICPQCFQDFRERFQFQSKH
jgi:hypothetical protein